MVRLSQLSLVVFSLMAYGTPGISVFFLYHGITQLCTLSDSQRFHGFTA